MARFRGVLCSFGMALAVTALAGCQTGQPAAHTAADWSYHGKTGPAFWPALFPKECAGEAQSPIELSGATREKLPALDLQYGTVPLLTARNSGHDIRVDVPAGAGSLRIGDDPTVWTLVEFHFHAPSEHLLRGTSPPMELHLVHQSGDRLAVIGVFFVPGEPNPELTKIWDRLPTAEGARTEVRDFNLAALVPERLTSYRYTGSLTTPACGQGVLWHVLAQPRTMTTPQLEAFHDIFRGLCFPDGNRRSTQPLNGRKVVTDLP